MKTVLLLTASGAGEERAGFTLVLETGGQGGARFTGHYGTARRVGADGDGVVDCLYKVASGQAGRRALSNEVAAFAGLRMENVRAEQFAELLGFDLEPAEGGARLLQTRRGRPLAVAPDVPFTPQRLWRPAHDLFTALRILADKGYAHHEISPGTVFWDGERLQIADLSAASNQHAEHELVRDVRTAAGLLYWLASGEESSLASGWDETTGQAELNWLRRFHPDLATVLRPAYEDPAPTAEEILDRMAAWPRPEGAPAPGPAGAGPGLASSPPPGESTAKDSPADAEKTERYKRGLALTPPQAADAPAPPAAPTTPAAPTSPAQAVRGDDLQAAKDFADEWERIRNRQPAARPPQPPRRPAARPHPETDTLRTGAPSPPEGFPFRTDADGKRRPHPALVWPVLFVLVILVLLMVL